MSKPNRYRTDTAEKGDEEPRRSRYGLALFILAVLGGVVGWFWLARDPSARDEMTRRIAVLEKNGLEFVSDLMDKFSTPPPPPEVGAVAGGSLPGAPPKYRSPIETTAELEEALSKERPVQEGGAETRGPYAGPEETPPPDAGRQDDAVVRIAFIDDLAGWMVTHYVPGTPAGRGGRLTSSLQGANLRYGLGMNGLAWIGDDLPAGRAAALDHIFTPGMLDALYKLYIDRFMEAVTRTANAPLPDGGSLTPAQRHEFYQLYARQFRGVSGALQAIASMPDFLRQMEALRAAADAVVNANAQYSELTFAADEARSNGEYARYATLRQQTEAKGRQYQEAVIARERSREAFIRQLKRTPDVRALDNASLIYIAEWIERRVRHRPEKLEAAGQAAGLFRDLAAQFEAAENAAGAAQ